MTNNTDNVKERAEELLSEKGGFWAMKPAESFRELIRDLLAELDKAEKENHKQYCEIAAHKSQLEIGDEAITESQAQVEALRVREGEFEKCITKILDYQKDYDPCARISDVREDLEQALATTSPEEGNATD